MSVDDEYNRLQCQKLDREYSIFELQLVEDWSFYWFETDGRRSRWTVCHLGQIVMDIHCSEIW